MNTPLNLLDAMRMVENLSYELALVSNFLEKYSKGKSIISESDHEKVNDILSELDDVKVNFDSVKESLDELDDLPLDEATKRNPPPAGTIEHVREAAATADDVTSGAIFWSDAKKFVATHPEHETEVYALIRQVRERVTI